VRARPRVYQQHPQPSPSKSSHCVRGGCMRQEFRSGVQVEPEVWEQARLGMEQDVGPGEQSGGGGPKTTSGSARIPPLGWAESAVRVAADKITAAHSPPVTARLFIGCTYASATTTMLLSVVPNPWPQPPAGGCFPRRCWEMVADAQTVKLAKICTSQEFRRIAERWANCSFSPLLREYCLRARSMPSGRYRGCGA